MVRIDVEWIYLNGETYKYQWNIFSDGSLALKDDSNWFMDDSQHDLAKFISQGCKGKVIRYMDYCDIPEEGSLEEFPHGCELSGCKCPYGFKNRLGELPNDRNNYGIIDISDD